MIRAIASQDLEAARVAARVKAKFKSNGDHVIMVQHISNRPTATFFLPTTPGVQLHDSVKLAKGDHHVVKHYPNSFRETNLHELLQSLEVLELTIIGMMTHMCIDSTTRQAMHLGLGVTVLDDATGTINLSDDLPAELVHRVELGVLGDGFATVTSTHDWASSLA